MLLDTGLYAADDERWYALLGYTFDAAAWYEPEEGTLEYTGFDDELNAAYDEPEPYEEPEPYCDDVPQFGDDWAEDPLPAVFQLVGDDCAYWEAYDEGRDDWELDENCL